MPSVDSLFPLSRPLASRLLIRRGLALLFAGAVGACTSDTTSPGSVPGPSGDVSSAPCASCVVGPVTLTRSTGVPDERTFSFAADPAASALLEIDDLATQGANAQVWLNGAVIFWDTALTSRRYQVLAVTLAEQNGLRVRLTGKPGSKLRVTLRVGAASVGSAGGEVVAPGSHARLTFAPGAVTGPTLVELTTGLATVPLYTPLTHYTLTLRIGRDSTSSPGDGVVRLTLSISSSVPAGSIAAVRLTLGDAILWVTGKVEDREVSVEMPGKHFFAPLSLPGVDALSLSAEAYESASAGAAGEGIALRGMGSRSGISVSDIGPITGKPMVRCPLYATSLNGWNELVGVDRGNAAHSAASIWHMANSGDLATAAVAIVVIPGLEWPQAPNCEDYRVKTPRPSEYFAPLIPVLRRDLAGYPLLAVDYPTQNDVHDSGYDLAGSLRVLQNTYPGLDVVLVGHSMGGLVAREAAARLGKKPLGIVTLATPHRGTPWADDLLAARWSPFLDNPGTESLIGGIAPQGPAVESPLIMHAGKTTFNYKCVGFLVCGWTTIPVSTPYMTVHGLADYPQLGRAMATLHGQSTSDGVVPDWSAGPPNWAVFVPSRDYWGYDHTYMAGGIAEHDDRIAADVRLLIARSPADLRVDSVDAPASVRQGTRYGITYQFVNGGGVAASGVQASYYLSTDAAFTASAVQVGGATTPVSVPAGGRSGTQMDYIDVPTLAPGNYYLGVLVDPGNVVPESNETNNWTSTPITVTATDQAPTPLTPAAGAVIPQNLLEPECLSGTGFVLDFSWTAVSSAKPVSGYEVYSTHTGAAHVAVDEVVHGTTDHHVSCDDYVADANLTGWIWRVRAVFSDGSTGPWSQEVPYSIAPAGNLIWIYDDFSHGLRLWQNPTGEGSWWTSDGALYGDYNITCGSVTCPQADLLLADLYQPPNGNWRIEAQSLLTQAYAEYNGGAMVNIAKFSLWASANEKADVEIGNWWQGSAPATSNAVLGVRQMYYPWQYADQDTLHVTWSPSQPQTAALEKHGNTYTAYWNNQVVFTFTQTFSVPPKVGVHTYGGVKMDNFKITLLP